MGCAHGHPRVPLGGCHRLPAPQRWCPAARWQRPQAPCPSRGDSPLLEFLLICLCNELRVGYEPGRVISRRWLVPASPAGLCQCRGCVRGDVGQWGHSPRADPPSPAGGCRGQVRDNGDCSPNNASLMSSPGVQPPPHSVISHFNPPGVSSLPCPVLAGHRWCGEEEVGVSLHPPAAFFIHSGMGMVQSPASSPAARPGHAATPSFGHCLCSPIPWIGIGTAWQTRGSSSCPAGHGLSLPHRAHTELP